MSLPPSSTLTDDVPTARIPVQRPVVPAAGRPALRPMPPRPAHGPSHRATRATRATLRAAGPRTWAESAARRRRRLRRARFGRVLLVLVTLAALTAAAVIWQLADGRPLDLLRDGWALLEPRVDDVVRFLRGDQSLVQE
ncbi:hypothetical protein GCM10023215_26470 [Pseudonocardia yuanmonensis]|uniref:Uncharacterized protein n=1 Tax=Pseudonocardia yuanmonensis TaxID=1095914 RepID=A0ABP8WJ06_9PSEU